MLTKLSMFQGADQTALTYCMCAILVQLLKGWMAPSETP